MKKLSLSRLAQAVASRRKALKLTQIQVSRATGINRALISRIESREYTPSVDQLLVLSDVLGFDVADVWQVPETERSAVDRSYRIAVAGMGYVGLSLAVLLSQHNEVTAVDIVPEKVEKLNGYVSPIQDEYIERFLAEARAGQRKLQLRATTDGGAAYRDADLILVLDEGRLVGLGDHETLLRENDAYREIYNTQFPDDEKGGAKRGKNDFRCSISDSRGSLSCFCCSARI